MIKYGFLIHINDVCNLNKELLDQISIDNDYYYIYSILKRVYKLFTKYHFFKYTIDYIITNFLKNMNKQDKLDFILFLYIKEYDNIPVNECETNKKTKVIYKKYCKIMLNTVENFKNNFSFLNLDDKYILKTTNYNYKLSEENVYDFEKLITISDFNFVQKVKKVEDEYTFFNFIYTKYKHNNMKIFLEEKRDFFYNYIEKTFFDEWEYTESDSDETPLIIQLEKFLENKIKRKENIAIYMEKIFKSKKFVCQNINNDIKKNFSFFSFEFVFNYKNPKEIFVRKLKKICRYKKIYEKSKHHTTFYVDKKK